MQPSSHAAMFSCSHVHMQPCSHSLPCRMVRVPPFNKTKLKRIQWLLAPPRRRRPWLSRLAVLCLLVVLGAVLVQVRGGGGREEGGREGGRGEGMEGGN